MADSFLTLHATRSQGSPPLTARNGGGASLQPGTRLTAQVLALTPSGATLQVGTQTLQVRSTTALSVGEQLNLKVTHAGRLLVLARREDAGPIGSVPRDIPQVARSLLRQQLPVQRGVGEVLGSLATLTRGPASSKEDPGVRQSAQALLAAIPRRDILGDASTLARAMAWAAGGEDAADLPGALGRLMAGLARSRGGSGSGVERSEGDHPPPLPGQRPVPQAQIGGGDRGAPSSQVLQEQLRGAIARFELLALAAMFPRSSERRAMALELPVLSGGEREDLRIDIIAMRIAQEQAPVREEGRRGSQHGEDLEHEEHPQHPWRAELAFDLPSTGPLEAVVTIRGGSRVSVAFHGADAAAAARVHDQLDRLGRSLADRGLRVDGLVATAVPARAPSCEAELLPMVDERA